MLRNSINHLIKTPAKCIAAGIFLCLLVMACSTPEKIGSAVVPARLTPDDNITLRNLLTDITQAPVRDTILIKHYHSHDDCWSTNRYKVSPDVIGRVMRLNKWLTDFGTNNPHITVLQIRQPGSGPLKFIKRNYDVKVDVKSVLLQFPMFGKQVCNLVWLIMPDGTLHKKYAPIR